MIRHRNLGEMAVFIKKRESPSRGAPSRRERMLVIPLFILTVISLVKPFALVMYMIFCVVTTLRMIRLHRAEMTGRRCDVTEWILMLVDIMVFLGVGVTTWIVTIVVGRMNSVLFPKRSKGARCAGKSATPVKKTQTPVRIQLQLHVPETREQLLLRQLRGTLRKYR